MPDLSSRELHGTYQGLNPVTKELLTSYPGDKKEFTQALNRVLIDWYRCGGTLEEFYQEFEKHPLSYSFHPALGSYKNVIRKAFNSAAEFVDRGADPVAVQEKAIALRDRVATWDLDGVRKYRTPRETWLTMLDVLVEDFQYSWNRGYRRLGIEAGVTAPTARRHVQAGIEIDLIRDQTPALTPGQISRGVPNPVAQLAFNLEWMEGELLALPVTEEENKGRNVTTRSLGIHQICCNKIPFVSDTAWSHVLGVSRRTTFESLGTEPIKVPAIAQSIGLSDKTVRDHLGFLEGKGLVTKTKATKGRGYEYTINQDADTKEIEEEAEYWRDQAVQRAEQERLDFNAYSSAWLGWYESSNRPLVPSSGGQPYRLNRDGLLYARGKHKGWEHQQVPEQYRDYTDDGELHRGLWVLPGGEVIEVEDTKLPPPYNGEWFDYLDADRPIDFGDIDPFAPAVATATVDNSSQGLAPWIDHGDEPPF